MKKQPRKTKISSKKSSKNDINNTTNNNMKQETTRLKVTNACKNCQVRKVKCTGNTTCQRCQRLKLSCEFLVPQKKRGPPKGRPLIHKRKVKKVVNKIVVCEKLNFRVGLSNKTSSENTQPINLNVNLNGDDLNNGMRDGDGNDEVNNDRIVEDAKDDNLIISSSNNFIQNNSYGNNNNNNNIVISNHNQYFANEILTSPLNTSGSTPMTTTRSFIKSSSPSSPSSSSSSSTSSPTSAILPTPMLIDTQFINYSISPTLMPAMPPVPIIYKSYLENLAMEENNKLISDNDSYNINNSFHGLLNTYPRYGYDEPPDIGNYYTTTAMPYNNDNNMVESNTYNVFNNYQYNNPLIVPSPSPNMFRDIFRRINSGDASSFLYNNVFE